MIEIFDDFISHKYPFGEVLLLQKYPKLGGFPDIPPSPPQRRGDKLSPRPPQKTEPFLQKVSFFEVNRLHLGNPNANTEGSFGKNFLFTFT